ncbi:MAG: hypothetical protein KDC27_02410, partial [Acidobacteria bacterium]|nr:hypothetical protein [Acidobacteriota bacterium]
KLVAVTDEQINLVIPEQAPTGALEVRLINGAGESAPMLVRLDRASPGLFAVLSQADQAISSIAPGQPVSVVATGLGPASLAAARAVEPAPGVQIVLGGMRLRPTGIEPFAAVPGTWRVRFDVPAVALPDKLSLGLLVDGRTGNELTLSSTASAEPAF